MTQSQATVALTGCAWEIPPFAGICDLSHAFRFGRARTPEFLPEIALGKKGLRYKERATLLALCAAQGALADAGWLDEAGGAKGDPHFGVVVASNTGNLDTVCRTVDTIRSAHVDATSSMDLPNASSNVVASTIAIRFGLKALNLMICSGSSASFDALVLAANAIRNGRAKRMLVVAVESDGLALRSLVGGRRLDQSSGESPLLEGAAAVVLESMQEARERRARIDARLSEYAFVHADSRQHQALYALLGRHLEKPRYLPSGCFVRPLHDEAFELPSTRTIDLGPLLVQSYGSGALLQLIHHCEQARGGQAAASRGAVVVGGGAWQDRRAGAIVVEPGSAAQ